jgi:hypothetical protein
MSLINARYIRPDPDSRVRHSRRSIVEIEVEGKKVERQAMFEVGVSFELKPRMLLKCRKEDGHILRIQRYWDPNGIDDQAGSNGHKGCWKPKKFRFMNRRLNMYS